MASHEFERSSLITGWKGTLTDIATFGGRMSEALGVGESISVTITERDGRRHEFPGPNQLRAVADSIAAASVAAIELSGKRLVSTDGGEGIELVSATARHVNDGRRSPGLELRAVAPTEQRVVRMHSAMARAARVRVPRPWNRWLDRVFVQKASFCLVGERRTPRTRVGRVLTATMAVLGEALGEAILLTIVAALALVAWRLL